MRKSDSMRTERDAVSVRREHRENTAEDTGVDNDRLNVVVIDCEHL
jgi:hypothetical protein